MYIFVLIVVCILCMCVCMLYCNCMYVCMHVCCLQYRHYFDWFDFNSCKCRSSMQECTALILRSKCSNKAVRYFIAVIIAIAYLQGAYIKKHGSVLCSHRQWGMHAQFEYIGRINKVAIFTHNYVAISVFTVVVASTQRGPHFKKISWNTKNSSFFSLEVYLFCKLFKNRYKNNWSMPNYLEIWYSK